MEERIPGECYPRASLTFRLPLNLLGIYPSREVAKQALQSWHELGLLRPGQTTGPSQGQQGQTTGPRAHRTNVHRFVPDFCYALFTRQKKDPYCEPRSVKCIFGTLKYRLAYTSLRLGIFPDFLFKRKFIE